MEIPESIANDLRCVECNEFLSCGPVFLIHNTSDAICGRCSFRSNEAINVPSTSSLGIQNKSRNLQYEAMAKLFSFPCPYPDCPEQMAFSEGEPNRHEYECKFRLFQCPIVETGSCGWAGARCDLIKHCTNKHPEQLYLENTCVLRVSDLKNFLVSAFNLLFLVHINVNDSSKHLIHSVRMLGDFNLVDNFSYFIKVKGNCSEFTLTGSVLSCKNMILQERFANRVSLKNMLEILGGKYNELMLIIKIKPSYKYCLNCFKNINHMMSRLKFCDECLETLEKCGFNGQSCSFVDAISIKCKKHLAFFCKYQTKCHLCQVTFNTGSLIEHLVSSDSLHEVIPSEYNLFVSIKPRPNSKNSYILFSHNNEIGPVIGQYNLCKSNFKLWLYTPLASHELKKFKCSIELKDPQTEPTKILTPKIQYNELFDWSINEIVKKCKKIDVKINIDKI